MLDLKNHFTFGKYRGTTIAEVIEDDISYVGWCLKNVKDFKLDKKASKFYEDRLALADDGFYDDEDNLHREL
jgi:hypothetical protein